MNIYGILHAPLNAAKATLAYRATAFGYANARIKAMKEGLLSEKEISAMAAAKDTREIIALLEKTKYREELVEEAAEHDKEGLIELALGRNLEKTIAGIKKLAPKQMQKEMQSILQRFDVHNIKTILLAKHLGKNAWEARHFLLQAGTIKKSDLEHMLSLEGVEKTVLFLGKTKYGSLLEDFLGEYKNTNSIQPMLGALDSHYFTRLVKDFTARHSSDRIVLGLLKAEIDKKNVANILRGKMHGIPGKELEKHIIPSGSMGEEILKKMSYTSDVSEAAKVLSERIDLKKALEKYNADKKISHFEIALETMVTKKSLSVLRRSILSIGTIIGFIFLKEEETKNIRKIVRAKEFNLGEQETEDMLVMAG